MSFEAVPEPLLSPLGYVLESVSTKYADFGGRARRLEYVSFVIVQTAVWIVVAAFLFLSGAADDGPSAANDPGRTALAQLAIGFAVLYGLVLLVPTLSVTVRRLHDAGFSAWWMLIGLLPFGGFVLIVFGLLDGVSGPNRWGPDPKRRGEAAAHR